MKISFLLYYVRFLSSEYMKIYSIYIVLSNSVLKKLIFYILPRSFFASAFAASAAITSLKIAFAFITSPRER